MQDELLEQIEKAAGKGNFSKWVKEACEMRLQTNLLKSLHSNWRYNNLY